MMLLRTYTTFLEECGIPEEDVDGLVAEALGHLRRIYARMGILDELAQAVQANMGQLPKSHPLQQERREVHFHLQSIQSELSQCAATVMRGLGVT